ncbi:ABC transporter substrate-binding protein [Saccharomonospora sp. NPDC046836]|uniref:ABC transporter substrate-binding protein n=1 Tax=Saccharomonospora sp. NPDC046836 TaxID=3156921 RepID=UPI003409D8B6
MNNRRSSRVIAVVLAAITLGISGCAAGLGGPPSSRTPREGVVRFTFAPDPIWDYMRDEGILEEFERERGLRIETSATWDEFGLFAGGHADIISSASFEVPDLQEQTGRETVIIGRYNTERSRLLVRAGDPARTLEDLRGRRLGVFTTVSGTLVWAGLARQMHDMDLVGADGAADIDLIVADIQNLSGLLARGEIDACICYPDLSVHEQREGSVRPLYNGRSSADLFAELNAPGHVGPMGNVFVAERGWAQAHPAEIEAFLDLWDRGLAEWRDHRAEIIARYPQHFAVQAPQDVAWITDYVTEHDWVVDEVRFDGRWAADESQVFDLLHRTGVIADEVTAPAFRTEEAVR